MLNWHKKREGWLAWAVKACPKDKFPPRYLLEVAEPRSTARKVWFIRTGGERTLVDTGDNLEAAKAIAQAHYEGQQNA